MVRRLAQLDADTVGTVAVVYDDGAPLGTPPAGTWFTVDDYDDPDNGQVFNPSAPVRFASPFDADRYNVIQQATHPSGAVSDAYWLYNRQGETVHYQGFHWINTLPTGTPNVWAPGVANWRKYEADGQGRAIWQQPTGAFDAYPTGFQVVHNPNRGQVRTLHLWASEIPANTTEPGGPGGRWDDLGEAV